MTDATLGKVRESIRRFGVVENLVARPLRAPRPLRGALQATTGCGSTRRRGSTPAGVHVVDLDDAQARLLAQTLNRTRGKDDPERYADLLRTDPRGLRAGGHHAAAPRDRAVDRQARRRPRRRRHRPGARSRPPSRGPSAARSTSSASTGCMCGDALDADQVAELLAGAEPTLLVTDPPYGVAARPCRWRDRDDRARQAPRAAPQLHARRRSFREKLGKTAPSLDALHGRPPPRAHRTTSISAATPAPTGPPPTSSPRRCRSPTSGTPASGATRSAPACARRGWEIAQQIIWDKGLFALTRQRYHWQHEGCYYAFRVGAEVPWYGPTHVPAFFARKPGSNAPWLGGADQSTVWTAASPKMIMGAARRRGGREVRPPDPEARRPLRPPDPQPPRARRLALRPVRRLRARRSSPPSSPAGAAWRSTSTPPSATSSGPRYAIYTRRPDLAPTRQDATWAPVRRLTAGMAQPRKPARKPPPAPRPRARAAKTKRRPGRPTKLSPEATRAARAARPRRHHDRRRRGRRRRQPRHPLPLAQAGREGPRRRPPPATCATASSGPAPNRSRCSSPGSARRPPRAPGRPPPGCSSGAGPSGG